MEPWFVFDLDDTLLLNSPSDAHTRTTFSPVTPDEQVTISIYAETRKVLDYLASRGYVITLASFRTNATETLRDFGLASYFRDVEYGQDTRTKLVMIQNLASRLHLNPYDAIFFDDNPFNVELCRNNLIYTLPVNEAIGVTLTQVFTALNASRLAVLYIVSSIPLPQEEIAAYFADFRVIFLPYCLQTEVIVKILDTLTDYEPHVLRVQQQGLLELFVGYKQYIVRTDDLYKGLEELFAEHEQPTIMTPLPPSEQISGSAASAVTAADAGYGN